MSEGCICSDWALSVSTSDLVWYRNVVPLICTEVVRELYVVSSTVIYPTDVFLVLHPADYSFALAQFSAKRQCLLIMFFFYV